MANNLDLWDSCLEDAKDELNAEADLETFTLPTPLTGQPDLNTAAEITRALARLATLLQYQEARLQLMELGRDSSMATAWTKKAAEMVDSLGIGSIGIADKLRSHGYPPTSPSKEPT